MPPVQKAHLGSGTPYPGASAVLLVGLLVTGLSVRGETALEVARYSAIGVGCSIALSAGMDFRAGWRIAFRADLMAIFALYFLTMFEFLLPQERFNEMVVDPQLLIPGVHVCLWGFAGLAIGRHFPGRSGGWLASITERPVSKTFPLRFFWFCFSLGFLHMLAAVSFNPVRMVELFFAPRFAQPWGRGQFGDWKALVTELGMILYLVPPLGGILLARRHNYSVWSIGCVSLGLLFTLFYGFSTGTRNVFASYLVTFLVGYVITLPPARKKEGFLISAICLLLLLGATKVMLDFRQIGLRNYLQNPISQIHEGHFQVDYNLYVISELVSVFPLEQPYLGLEIPYLALVRPIPRAIWPEKPEGMSMGIESALGAEGLTLASTFVGEAYMSGGIIAVVLAGFCFSWLARWWGRLTSANLSDFGLLIYASGFFAIVISMRSLLVFTTAILPTVVAIVLGWFLMGSAEQQRPLSRRRKLAHESAVRI